MGVDPRQPVLVGIGTCMQREQDFTRAREPMDLMLAAVRNAGADAAGDKAAEALAGVQFIAVPKGRWRYRNPAGEIARAIGARSATTVLASVGVLQQSLIGDACGRIAAGEIDSALVAGADAGYRLLRAKQAGERSAERQQQDDPDISLESAEELLHPAELHAGIRMPVALYAILESAFRARKGWSVAEHRQRLGKLYQRFSEVAAANPDAWRRQPLSAADISAPSQRNPMQAFPYTRMHCSSWNVDQAAALLICSAARAEALGIHSSRWVHARASTECNHMLPVSARADLARCEGAELAGVAALEAAGVAASQLDLVELYSCFPVAVESCAEALGLAPGRDLTVTGGMPFAGGPFNNYVLQATCRMAQLLRRGHAQVGLQSSISGIMTKQAFGIWARTPAANGFSLRDVTRDAGKNLPPRVVVQGYHGNGVVAGYTVLHEHGQAPRALVLADTAGGCRALAWNTDAALIDRIEQHEFCGAPIALQDGVFTAA